MVVIATHVSLAERNWQARRQAAARIYTLREEAEFRFSAASRSRTRKGVFAD
jgi:hypothetical protein